MSEKIIEFINVVKEHPDGTRALDDISFAIKPGEFVFLIGASGAGKTTLMNQIVLDDTPSVGEVVVDSQELSKISRSDIPLLRRKVGFIFQDFKLLNSKTAYENVALSLYVAGRTADEARKIVPDLLHLVGLGDKSERFPQALSGGERQRLAIARALAHEPKILLADEPTGNLDRSATWIVVDLIKKINDWGTTIIFGTHDTEIVNTLKKRVIHLDKGKIVRDQEEGTYE
jgi:cell division transport system ATP-binding protein